MNQGLFAYGNSCFIISLLFLAMPGVHTFYDGSRILEPLVPFIGFECDKVGFLDIQ